jgi:hypothetical protein
MGRVEVDGLDPPMRMNQDTLFCAGHAPLADGRMLLVGGQRSTPELGLEYAFLFDYRTAPDRGWTPIETSILGWPGWFASRCRSPALSLAISDGAPRAVL